MPLREVAAATPPQAAAKLGIGFEIKQFFRLYIQRTTGEIVTGR